MMTRSMSRIAKRLRQFWKGCDEEKVCNEDTDDEDVVKTGTDKWHEQCSKCGNTKHNRDWVYCVMNRAYCDSCSPSWSCDYTYCPACYCQNDSDEDTDNEDE